MPPNRERVGLPPRPFLYTLDQIAVLLNVDESALYRNIFFDGRTSGFPTKFLMNAHNINLHSDQRPDWRVAESELIRWLRLKGFKYYDRGVVGN